MIFGGSQISQLLKLCVFLFEHPSLYITTIQGDNKMKNTFKGSSRLHLALNTNQLKESIKFYEALFNIKPIKIKSGYVKFEVEEPQINLTLNETHEVLGNQLNHLGIEVKSPESVEDQLLRLKKLGLETSYEKNTSCCYADQDKVWVTDPNGNAWETFFVLSDSDHRSDPTSDSECCIANKDTVNSCC